MALDRCRAPQFNLPSSHFAAVVSPLRWERWQCALQGHPDREFVAYITGGIRSGLCVGFQCGAVACQSRERNMQSAQQCRVKVAEFLALECAAGRILGPFDPGLVPTVHINSLGAVPKSTPGKYRLIVDLSSPEGYSVNDGIEGALCSLSYVSVESRQCCGWAEVRPLGGALLAKVDIRSAYRNIPIHPNDR